AIALIYGSDRRAMQLIGYWDFKNLGNSKGGKGGLLKNSQQQYQATVLGMLCEGTILGIGAAWDSQGNLLTQQTTENYTVPGGGATYTPTNSPGLVADLGATRADAYSYTVNDYGSPGSVTLSGTTGTPMTRVPSSPGAGQYSFNTGTGQYTFSAADVG